MNTIRNFAIIAHIDHGKSTLADRFLELTGSVSKEKIVPQYLDRLSLERERGITIKMQPVRMLWHPDRGITQNDTQNNAELLYEDLTYKIRGALFQVRKKIGLGHKEQIYHNALEIEFKKGGLKFESKKNIPILYDGKKIGTYQPDFVIEGKVLIELKSLPEIGKTQIEQIWSYLKGCDYRLALLVNYGSTDLQIKRIVYDTARASHAQPQTHAEYTQTSQNLVSASSAPSLRMSAGVTDQIENEEYILNLIDTPGHADFGYEVSRALKAVEGVIFLVDAVKGVQAQSMFNFRKALEQGLTIIPVVNKVDLREANIERTEKQIIDLFLTHNLPLTTNDIFRISAKSGLGVKELLEAVIKQVPKPKIETDGELQALIFDSLYDGFKGVLAYVRVFQGKMKPHDMLQLLAAQQKFQVKEVGIFTPDFKPIDVLGAGSIGYIATGIKESGMVKIGDTIAQQGGTPLEGFSQPKPNVFASFYPLEEGEFENLKTSLEKLQLNDPAISFERTESPLLGRGFRVGFLGKLHMEIVAGRLDEELKTQIIIGTPSVAYEVDGKIITSPLQYPEHKKDHTISEPWVSVEIFSPSLYLGQVMKLLEDAQGIFKNTLYLDAENVKIVIEMPLAYIVTQDFYDKLKSVSKGFASAEYESIGMRKSKKVRLDMLVAGDLMDAFSKIVSPERAYEEGRRLAKLLKDIIPHAQFVISIQARVEGKVIAREDIPALKKAVTEPLYGGDFTRKKKLLVKQREGKKRMRQFGRVQIPKEVFLKAI